MTTYNVTFTPFRNSASVSGKLDLTINGSAATASVTIDDQPAVSLSGTVAPCGSNAQIISMTPTIEFPLFIVIEPSAPALRLGIGGFYVSTESASETAGTFGGLRST